VDDMIDSGRTIVKAAEALHAAGALGVVVAATHAVFSDPAVELLQSKAITSVVVTDTLPIPPEKRFPTLTVLPIAPLLARAIRAVFEDDSVTSMFDGAA
jgi:ribose-phosphate pyrophosphokinase